MSDQIVNRIQVAAEELTGIPASAAPAASEPAERQSTGRGVMLLSAACIVVLLVGLAVVATERDVEPIVPAGPSGSASDTADLDPSRSSVPTTHPTPAPQVVADIAEAGIPPADDARNRAIAETLVDAVVGLGADMSWEPTDVVVRLKDNVPFYMTAVSPEGGDQASVTIEIRQYQADELADPDFLEEIGLSQPVERFEDGSSLFIRDAPESGFASANVVVADLVISVQSQNLVSQDRAPVKASILADAARGLTATAQRELSANE